MKASLFYTLHFTTNVPSSRMFVTLMMEALLYSETSVLTRSTRPNIPEDSILCVVSVPQYTDELQRPVQSNINFSLPSSCFERISVTKRFDMGRHWVWEDARTALGTPAGSIISQLCLILHASIWKHACTLLIAKRLRFCLDQLATCWTVRLPRIICIWMDTSSNRLKGSLTVRHNK
jgi:hypothetical protein